MKKFLNNNLLIIILLSSFYLYVVPEKGIIGLDEYTFDKIIDGSKNVLVEFMNQAWETTPDLETVGREFASSNDIIIAKFINSANEDFVKRFNFKPEESPSLRFYPKGSTTPENFLVSAKGVKGDDIVELLRIRLNPNLKELKALAAEFVTEDAKRNELLKKAETLTKSFSGVDADYAKQIIKNMQKILEKGISYVETEKSRLTKLSQSSSVSEKTRNDFNKKISILNAFTQEKKNVV